MRSLGLFALARQLTRRRLRILCYHGFSIGDQHEYAPVMFMRPEIFERRLAQLARLNYPVLPLDAAVEKLRAGEIRNCEVVITIDDGWKSTVTLAAPLLAKYRYPACLYLTTYYVERNDAIFNVVVHYLFWRTHLTEFCVRDIATELNGTHQIKGNEATLVSRWVSYGERHLNGRGRQELLRTLARHLEVDYELAIERQRFALIEPGDIKALLGQGIDIQLHTHRHQFPAASFAAAAKEIADNQAVLERLGAGVGRHFCYPSGQYTADHPGWLERLGIASATTCEPGLNATHASPFLLSRYLDRDDAEDIEFDAELSGFSDFLRMIRVVRTQPSVTTVGATRVANDSDCHR